MSALNLCVPFSVLWLLGCPGRDCPKTHADPGDVSDDLHFPEPSEYELFKNAYVNRESTSAYRRSETEGAYLAQSLKNLLRARELAPKAEPQIDMMIRETMILMCRPESSPRAMEDIKTRPIEDLYPLLSIVEVKFVTCGSFVLRSGKVARGRFYLQGWD